MCVWHDAYSHIPPPPPQYLANSLCLIHIRRKRYIGFEPTSAPCECTFTQDISGGFSGRVRGGEKHDIYVAASGSHLFMTYFHRAGGGMAPSALPPDPLLDVWGGKFGFDKSNND